MYWILRTRYRKKNKEGIGGKIKNPMANLSYQ
jgi:hypothetical protein